MLWASDILWSVDLRLVPSGLPWRLQSSTCWSSWGGRLVHKNMRHSWHKGLFVSVPLFFCRQWTLGPSLQSDCKSLPSVHQSHEVGLVMTLWLLDTRTLNFHQSGTMTRIATVHSLMICWHCGYKLFWISSRKAFTSVALPVNVHDFFTWMEPIGVVGAVVYIDAAMFCWMLAVYIDRLLT